MNVFAPTRYVRIKRNLLPPKFRVFQHLLTDTGKADYIGQILLQWEYDVPPGIRFPSELANQLGKLIPFFTIEIRGAIVDSSLTLEIMKLDQLPQHIQEAAFVKLMDQHGIKVTIQ